MYIYTSPGAPQVPARAREGQRVIGHCIILESSTTFVQLFSGLPHVSYDVVLYCTQ